MKSTYPKYTITTFTRKRVSESAGLSLSPVPFKVRRVPRLKTAEFMTFCYAAGLQPTGPLIGRLQRMRSSDKQLRYSIRAIMASVCESSWFQISLSLFLLVFLYYVYFKVKLSKYWKERNIFQIDPVFLLGNNWKGFFSEGIGFSLEKRYRVWKEKKLIGYWSFTTPTLLVTDLELIRRILIRDFNHFTDRNINVNEEIDPLAGHLVNLAGSKWRNLRVKLTPTFTSGKMKMMFPTMADCGFQLQEYLAKPAEKGETLEIKEILARFTTDIISSCAFGIESNCLNNPNSEFRNHGKKIFEPSLRFLTRFILTSFFPRVRNFLRIPTISKDITNFFINVVKETMDYRQEKGIKRNDFMELLIQLKNKGKLDDVDSENKNSTASEQKFTLQQAAAQAFVFFAAGFETSSTTLSYAFYELAFNPEVQTTLQGEIDVALAKTDGKITYDGLMEMEYLDCVIQETLRKYPPIPFLGRKCTKEYVIPEMNVKLDKGTRILISVLGIQRDPQYFPDPERFDPKRFSPEEKAQRNRLTFLPFGEGPRNCIGNRFGLLQAKIGLVSVLSEYKVEISADTPTPLTFNKNSFILTPSGGIPINIIKRKDK